MPVLTRYAYALIAVHVVLIPLGILADWPAQFDASREPDAGSEWASKGTAVSAPLAPLLALGLGGFLAQRASRWGIAGAILLLLAGVAILIGSLGEAFADAEETPRAVLVVSGVVGGLLAIALIALAARELVARVRGSRTSTS